MSGRRNPQVSQIPGSMSTGRAVPVRNLSPSRGPRNDWICQCAAKA